MEELHEPTRAELYEALRGVEANIAYLKDQRSDLLKQLVPLGHATYYNGDVKVVAELRSQKRRVVNLFKLEADSPSLYEAITERKLNTAALDLSLEAGLWNTELLELITESPTNPWIAFTEYFDEEGPDAREDD